MTISSPYRPASRHGAVFAAILSTLVGSATPVLQGAGAEARLQVMQQEISKLEEEVQSLKRRERGVLGEMDRLGAELRLHEAEFREVSLRLEHVSGEIDVRDLHLAELESDQASRQDYLAFRLRELYRAGPHQALRRLIAGAEVEKYWAGLRYAAFLSDRDGRMLHEFREAAIRIREERHSLASSRDDLSSTQAEVGTTRERLQSSRRQRSRLLNTLRVDQTKREGAIEELRAAGEELSRIAGSLSAESALPSLDMRKFQGLLEWPARGKVTAAFGTVVHPRFKTEVPHPGLDIEGRLGADIRSVFGGKTVFASWMRGYGLTTIVDHGGGMLSIYAHASVLLVEPGQDLVAGQLLGKVGDTGSLRGTYLYFELRVDGRPTDPIPWLRRR